MMALNRALKLDRSARCVSDKLSLIEASP